MTEPQRATRAQLENLARLLLEHVMQRMSSDDPSDRSPAFIRVARLILKDAQIRALAATPSMYLGDNGGGSLPFMPTRLRDDEDDDPVQ
jgi:hypothetical protein